MLRSRAFRWHHAAVALGLATACAGARFDGHTFRDGPIAFRLQEVPPSWRRIDADGSLLAFRDDGAQASIAVGGRCHKDGDDVPLVSLTHHLFLHFTDRQVLEQTHFDLDGRAALHTRLSAELDGVPKQFDVVVLKKDGCVYDFVQVAAPGVNEAARERFLTFVRGFSTVGS
jgi:hypothetical protein